MKLKVFLDTNVFIYAFEFSNSNSAKVIDLLNKGAIEVFISSQVVKEVVRYFERYHSVELAHYFRRYLLESCIVISGITLSAKMQEFKGQIKDKDLEQLAATKVLGLKFLVSYDRDFEKFSEYITPREFVKVMKVTLSPTEF